MLGLVDLVAGGTEGTGDTVSHAVLSGNVSLGLLLVALLGGLGGVALDGLGDVVGSVLDRLGGRADDAVVGVVGAGSRHCDGVMGWWVGKRSGLIVELEA